MIAMKIDTKDILLIVLILFAFAALMLMYFSQGPNWDLVATYLYGKSITNHNFLIKNFTITSGTIYTSSLYIELLREPVPGFTLAAISLAVSNSDHVFLIFLRSY
jgi:hypothetical protein